MPQSEMEALIQLQKETIDPFASWWTASAVRSSRWPKTHEEQTAQLNQTIANL